MSKNRGNSEATSGDMSAAEGADHSRSDESDSDGGGEDGFIRLDHTSTAESGSADQKAMPMQKAFNAATPWRRESTVYTQASPILRLHQEICDFTHLMRPTIDEVKDRSRVEEDLKAVVSEVCSSAKLIVFGSSTTGLALPRSDIDAVVMGYKGGLERLTVLARAIQRRGVGEDIEVISSARIPLVKFTHCATQLPVDICFDTDSGVATANMAKEFLRKLPAVKPLVVVLKFFLRQRQLHETYRGGIGSFLLLLMVVGFCQHYTRAYGIAHTSIIHSKLNLGIYLLNFFEFYSKRLNFITTGLRLKGSGSFYNKQETGKYLQNRPFLLSIENPCDPSLDVGANAWAINKVRKAFENAFEQLKASVKGLRALRESSGVEAERDESILNTIVAIPDELMDRCRRKALESAEWSSFKESVLNDSSIDQGDSNSAGSDADGDSDSAATDLGQNIEDETPNARKRRKTRRKKKMQPASMRRRAKRAKRRAGNPDPLL